MHTPAVLYLELAWRHPNRFILLFAVDLTWQSTLTCKYTYITLDLAFCESCSVAASWI